MAAFWERDGIRLTLLPKGKLAIEIDAAKLTAASELDVIGPLRVYEVDMLTLAKNTADEARWAIERIRKVSKRIRKAVR